MELWSEYEVQWSAGSIHSLRAHALPLECILGRDRTVEITHTHGLHGLKSNLLSEQEMPSGSF